MLEAQHVFYIHWSGKWGYCTQLNQRSKGYGIQLNQEVCLANLHNSSLNRETVQAIMIWGENSMVFSAYTISIFKWAREMLWCIQLSLTLEGCGERLCHFPMGLKLWYLTCLCSCQWHIFTKDFIHSLLPLLPTGTEECWAYLWLFFSKWRIACKIVNNS